MGASARRIGGPARRRSRSAWEPFSFRTPSWANAARAIGNLKKEGLLTESALKKVRKDHLARLIRPARFFNMKARRLKGFVAYLWKHFEGNVDKFLSLPTEKLHEELLSLDGVGRETADSITLYAAGRAVFVVDAYTKRIFSRLGHFEASKNGDKDYLALQKASRRICPPTSFFSTNTTPCSCVWGTPAAARSPSARNARCALFVCIPDLHDGAEMTGKAKNHSRYGPETLPP